MRVKKILICAVVLVFMMMLFAGCDSAGVENGNDETYTTQTATQTAEAQGFDVIYAQPRHISEFVIPPLDLRGFALDHVEAQQWFLERLNYHRENYGVHPYELYAPATITSIEHSLDMRDNNFTRNEASDGRVHQERHHRWMGYGRTRITSTAVLAHTLSPGPLTRQGANEVIDRVLSLEDYHLFLMNPTYYYIGIGFSVCEEGRGRICFTMASQEGKRAAHHARTPEEREQYRQDYLERVRQERGWTAPN